MVLLSQSLSYLVKTLSLREIAGRLRVSLCWWSADERTGLVDEAEKFVGSLGTQHGYAVVTKVGDALEEGAVGYVAARVEYATPLVKVSYTGEHLLLENGELPVGSSPLTID